MNLAQAEVRTDGGLVNALRRLGHFDENIVERCDFARAMITGTRCRRASASIRMQPQPFVSDDNIFVYAQSNLCFHAFRSFHLRAPCHFVPTSMHTHTLSLSLSLALFLSLSLSLAISLFLSLCLSHTHKHTQYTHTSSSHHQGVNNVAIGLLAQKRHGMYAHTLTHTHAHTRTHTHTYTHTHICAHTLTHTNTHIHTRTHSSRYRQAFCSRTTWYSVRVCVDMSRTRMQACAPTDVFTRTYNVHLKTPYTLKKI